MRNRNELSTWQKDISVKLTVKKFGKARMSIVITLTQH
jgi:hypothetical protein